MKKFLITVISLLVAMTLLIPSAPAYAFLIYSDVPWEHWAYDAIEYATDRHYFSGYADGSFQPDRTITRAEAAKVLAMYINLIRHPVTQSSFKDVDPDAWYAAYVEAVKDYFPNMEGKKYFYPDEPVTREDVVYILVNTKNLNNKIKYLDMSLVDNFTDSKKIDEAVKAHLAIGVQTALLSGYSDGTIKPKSALTRAEFAVLMHRAEKISKSHN